MIKTKVLLNTILILKFIKKISKKKQIKNLVKLINYLKNNKTLIKLINLEN